MKTWIVVAALASLAPVTGAAQAAAPAPPPDLTGLWTAQKRFPAVRGPVLIQRATGGGLTAEVQGFLVPVREQNGELWFDLPSPDGGGFRGKLESNGTIRGIWFAAAVGELGPASPLVLAPRGRTQWIGQIIPLDEPQTFHLLVTPRPDGSLGAALFNPERDLGSIIGVKRLVRTANRVELWGGRGNRDTVLLTGSFDSAQQVLAIDIPYRGGYYDFRRDTNALSDFYPRGKTPGRYVYRVPPALDDGWPTASLDAVGIDRAAIEHMIQQVIDLPMDSIGIPQTHAILIVRHGKLVLEEYFHGEHRDKVHNTRSASKSVAATIIGAAMYTGAPLTLSSHVYQIMNAGAFPDSLEPRKRAMTLEHLMTMSSGYFCDDNNDSAPGNENGMWDQERQPDFYKFTLPLPLAFAPGDTAIYCSINPNLALGMAGRAAGESPFYLFDRLIATPLGIHHYIWAVDRARNPYGGGGMAFVARDFLKFGQLMLQDGTWRGRRILSHDFVARAESGLVKIGSDQRPYGLLWWPQEYPYQGRTVRGFAALGNGGNVVMVFPELDLVVATNGANYASRGWRGTVGLIPSAIIPAVRP